MGKDGRIVGFGDQFYGDHPRGRRVRLRSTDSGGGGARDSDTQPTPLPAEMTILDEFPSTLGKLLTTYANLRRKGVYVGDEQLKPPALQEQFWLPTFRDLYERGGTPELNDIKGTELGDVMKISTVGSDGVIVSFSPRIQSDRFKIEYDYSVNDEGDEKLSVTHFGEKRAPDGQTQHVNNRIVLFFPENGEQYIVAAMYETYHIRGHKPYAIGATFHRKGNSIFADPTMEEAEVRKLFDQTRMTPIIRIAYGTTSPKSGTVTKYPTIVEANAPRIGTIGTNDELGEPYL